MKSNEWIRRAEIELKQRKDHAAFLRNRGLEDLGKNVLTAVGAGEDILRAAGFTVKVNESGDYTIKCKWSDAPEVLKNEKRVRDKG